MARSSGIIAPRILHLGTKFRWVVNFTPLPFHPQKRAPGAHWIGGCVGLQSRSGRGGGEKVSAAAAAAAAGNQYLDFQLAA
jgi:hypothetical protein